MYPRAQHPQTMIVMMPVLTPARKPSGMPALVPMPTPALQQPNPVSSSSALLAQAPAQKQPAQTCQEPAPKQEPAEKQPPAPKAVPKTEGKEAKSGSRTKIANGQSWLDTMPAEKKEALCKYIY